MNDESEIRAEVERRKRRAKEVGIVDIVFRLFEERLRDLKAKVDYREHHLPDSVKNVIVATRQGKYVPYSIEVVIDERPFKFVFVEFPPVGEDEDGQTIKSKLRLRSGRELLLELECSRTTPIFGTEYIFGRDLRVDQVLAFVEGTWVQEIKDFAHHVFDAEDQHKAKLRQEQRQRELEDMKKRFGL